MREALIRFMHMESWDLSKMGLDPCMAILTGIGLGLRTRNVFTLFLYLELLHSATPHQ